MAIHNNLAVYINGINRTSNLVIPSKFGNFLDERLDECLLSLRQIKKDIFEPLTPVEIVLTQTEYFGKWGAKDVNIVATKRYNRKFIVADDSATEVTPGTGVYNHELYCLEVTKTLERVVVDTLTVTNDIGRNYAANTVPIEPIVST